VTGIDEFLAVVAKKMQEQLAAVEPSGSETLHWIVVADNIGAEISEQVPTGVSPHELLASLITNGGAAAAYVTYVPAGPARVLADVLVADPRNSDVRQALVLRDPRRTVALGGWEPTV